MSVEPLSLWDLRITPPTTADPMSRAAAASIAAISGSVRRSVAEYVGAHGPIAEYAIEYGLELRGNTVRPRLWELVGLGLVETQGRGVTPAGRSCHLYVLTASGRAALDDEP